MRSPQHERSHLYPRARPRRQEPPLLLTQARELGDLAYLAFNGASLAQAQQRQHCEFASLVVDERPLVEESIGCVRWSVIFCGNPFGDRHAFGEAPTS